MPDLNTEGRISNIGHVTILIDTRTGSEGVRKHLVEGPYYVGKWLRLVAGRWVTHEDDANNPHKPAVRKPTSDS